MRRRSVLYAVVHDDQRVTFGHSPRPEVDRRFWLTAGGQRLVPLGPSLPPVWAELACRALAQTDLQRAEPGSGRRMSTGPRWLGWLLARRRCAHTDPLREPVLREAITTVRQLLRSAGYDWSVRQGDPLRVFPGIFPGIIQDLAAGAEGLGAPEALGGREPSPTALDGVASVLRGRLLTGAEVTRQVEQAGVALERPLEECLTWLVLVGRVQRFPGVYPVALGGFQCQRCGEVDQVRPWDCAACGERQCWRCEACRSMGLVSGCVFLYAADVEGTAGPGGTGSGTVATVPLGDKKESALCRGPTPGNASTALPPSLGVPAPNPSPVTARLPALTTAQRRAAWALERFVREPGQREALVWAVCGAGKTEVTFIAASRVLDQGGRVLFAVPRRDVVQELGPRLAAAFPATELRVLHGGPDRVDRPGLAPGSLTIATTHQALRFYRAFDLAILDEVDAYPYRGSPMLVRAMDRAVREGGRLIRMSATPDDGLIQAARAGKSLLVPIPARHHGHPLPVPELLIDRALVPRAEGAREWRPSQLVLSLVHRSLADAPPARLLVFVPTITLAEQVGLGMAAALAGTEWHGRVDWSHSRDPGREHKRRAFARGELVLLVATTILERGITLPDVDVIVLFSDVEHIFQTAALVQMAGRVGRTTQRPTGRVTFAGRRITRAMRQAVAQIEEMNRLARTMGLLRV